LNDTDIGDLDRSDSHSCIPSVQNGNFPLDKLLYAFDVEIDLLLLNPAYPKEPKTLGEYIRKARMDKGLLIRELAALVGVTADTVINWELRGVKPMGRSLTRIQEALEVIASGVEG
jgi:hypothetical protein